MELGTIQKAWIADLRKYPERQLKYKLGKKNKETGEIKACCLGQGILTLCEIENINPVWEDRVYGAVLFDESSFTKLTSYKKLGLRDGVGRFLKTNEPTINDKKFITLSDMNDNGLNWSEIADYIEANPKNIFKKSV